MSPKAQCCTSKLILSSTVGRGRRSKLWTSSLDLVYHSNTQADKPFHLVSQQRHCFSNGAVVSRSVQESAEYSKVGSAESGFLARR